MILFQLELNPSSKDLCYRGPEPYLSQGEHRADTELIFKSSSTQIDQKARPEAMQVSKQMNYKAKLAQSRTPLAVATCH
jgi:hypothetical protein